MKEMPGTDQDLGMFFAKGIGPQIVTGIRKTIGQLQAEELPLEEKTHLSGPPMLAGTLLNFRRAGL